MRTFVTVITLILVSSLFSWTRGNICSEENRPTAISFGDPHIMSFDGYRYDVQRAGEFQFCKLENTVVNVQHTYYFNSFAYINTAVSFTHLDNKFEVIRSPSFYYFFFENGQPIELNRDQTKNVGSPPVFSVQYLVDSSYFRRIIINTMSGIRLSIEIVNNFYLNLDLLPDLNSIGKTSGLCGSYDCLTNDESQLQTPLQFQVPADQSSFTNILPQNTQLPTNSLSSSRTFGSPQNLQLRKKRDVIIPADRRSSSNNCCIRFFPHLENPDYSKELEFCIMDVYSGNEDLNNCQNNNGAGFLRNGVYGPSCKEYLGQNCDDNYVCDRQTNPAQPQCVCAPGFSGPTCSDTSQICSSCTGAHQLCANTVCTCTNGYTGSNCTVPPPPSKTPSNTQTRAPSNTPSKTPSNTPSTIHKPQKKPKKPKKPKHPKSKMI